MRRALASLLVRAVAGLAFLAVMIALVLIWGPNSPSPANSLKGWVLLADAIAWLLVGPFLAAAWTVRICGFRWMEAETRAETSRVRAWCEAGTGAFSLAASPFILRASGTLAGALQAAAGLLFLGAGVRRITAVRRAARKETP